MATAERYDSVDPTLRPSHKTGCGVSDSNRIWLNKDVCGVVCGSITWFIVLYCMYTFVWEFMLPWMSTSALGLVHMTLFYLSATLGLVSHLKAMLSNPGAVPLNAKPVEASPLNKQCPRCRCFKPARAHHCSVCGRCVIKMDHHCPWVNNCVGLANQKFFLLFLFYIWVICAYALVCVSWRYWYCISTDYNVASCPGSLGSGGFVIGMVIFAIMFGLFTFCMMVDQSQGIIRGANGIDRLKGGNEYDAPDITRDQMLYNLSEVFGGEPTNGFRLHWLLPTSIHYPDPERLTGYCFREPKHRAVLSEEEAM